MKSELEDSSMRHHLICHGQPPPPPSVARKKARRVNPTTMMRVTKEPLQSKSLDKASLLCELASRQTRLSNVSIESRDPVNELNSQRNQNLYEIDFVSLSDGEEVYREWRFFGKGYSLVRRRDDSYSKAAYAKRLVLPIEGRRHPPGLTEEKNAACFFGDLLLGYKTAGNESIPSSVTAVTDSSIEANPFVHHLAPSPLDLFPYSRAFNLYF
ncbi:unnamed protein product [Lupinus luteus]|uniref:Uncharacterized protein n=1 Tax=Lupinus luteus TaxID=3873 RepID=A0AAV1XQ25_LUPLU